MYSLYQYLSGKAKKWSFKESTREERTCWWEQSERGEEKDWGWEAWEWERKMRGGFENVASESEHPEICFCFHWEQVQFYIGKLTGLHIDRTYLVLFLTTFVHYLGNCLKQRFLGDICFVFWKFLEVDENSAQNCKWQMIEVLPSLFVIT